MQLEGKDITEERPSGWHVIPLDEMSFLSTMEDRKWLEEKGHYTKSQKGKQLGPDREMTRFLQGRESGSLGKSQGMDWGCICILIRCINIPIHFPILTIVQEMIPLS